MLKDAYFNGLLHLKSEPPGRGLTFSSYPLKLAKTAFTPEDFRKIWVYPWRIGSCPWRIWVYPWRILRKLRLHPQRIPYIFTLLLKKSSIFITYPGEFHGSSTGGGGVRILNAIAWQWLSMIYPKGFCVSTNSQKQYDVPSCTTKLNFLLHLCHLSHCQWSWQGVTQNLLISSPFLVHKMYFSEKQSPSYRSSS